MVDPLFPNVHAADGDPLLDRLRRVTAADYEIRGELGRGGMAVVYLAIDRKLDRPVAIKVMDPRLMLTDGMAQRFLREARIAARLQHPNIIVVHEIRAVDDIIFFVMSLVDGAAVDDVCRATPRLPIDEAQWVLSQAAKALAFAHAEGVVHRDIKPANILVNLKGDIILTDFGIAKAAGGEALTKLGDAVGSPLYMSPEHFSGDEAGAASDQYSLGVTAYQMIAGETPFAGNMAQLFAAHVGTAPIPLIERRPDCPAVISDIVMRMLAKAPASRFPSVEAVHELFATGIGTDGGAARRRLAGRASAVRNMRFVGASDALTKTVRLAPPPAISDAPRRRSPVTTLRIAPVAPLVDVGSRLRLTSEAFDASGARVSDAGVLWSSSAPAIIRVDMDGTIAVLCEGIARITAMADGVVDSIELMVVASSGSPHAAEGAIARSEFSPVAFDGISMPAGLPVGSAAHDPFGSEIGAGAYADRLRDSVPPSPVPHTPERRAEPAAVDAPAAASSLGGWKLALGLGTAAVIAAGAFMVLRPAPLPDGGTRPDTVRRVVIPEPKPTDTVAGGLDSASHDKRTPDTTQDSTRDSARTKKGSSDSGRSRAPRALSAGDMRAGAQSVASALVSNESMRSTSELRAFFAEGTDHTAVLIGEPEALETVAGGQVIGFTIRLSRLNGDGQRERRLVSAVWNSALSIKASAKSVDFVEMR